MVDLITYGKWLAAVEILLTILLLVAMVRRGLARTYRVFFVYMAFQPIGRMAYLLLDPATNPYAYFYVIRTPIFWVLSILVVYELYDNILADYPGILSFGRQVLTATFAASAGVSLLSARYDWNRAVQQSSQVLFYYTFAERGITTAQALFLLAMTMFLRWFPGQLKRNIHVHTVILFLYFLGRSASFFIRNSNGSQVNGLTNLAIMIVTCLCLMGWIWQFSPERTDRKVALRTVDEREAQRIVTALRSLNNALLGAGKRRPER